MKQHVVKISFLLALGLVSCGPKWTETESNGVKIVTNPEGQTLGYSSASGVKIITADRLGFKDLNKNGQLDKYEDWRLSADDRAKDLASKMSIDQIAGLMLYSRHQSIPAASRGFMAATYNGKDPRNGTDASAEYNEGAGGKISMWPSSLGMAALFDAGEVKKFGKIAAVEYRALGISTALSPQVDLA